MKKRNLIILSTAIIILFNSCILTYGSIYIKEHYVNRGFSIKCLGWTNERTCKMDLNENEKLSFEIDLDRGNVGIDFEDIHGAKSYFGNKLTKASFIVTVPKTNHYTITLKGHMATGKIKIKKL